jgi:nucleotide-binding universal stress UspA family protein
MTSSAAGTIVVGVDGSPSSATALAWAADQARRRGRPVTVVHAVGAQEAVWTDQSGADNRPGTDHTRATAQGLLDEAAAEVQRRAPGVEVRDLLRVADPRDVLLELSQEAEMLVLGSRGRGMVRSLLLGSVGVALTRHAACPVVVLRPSNPGLVRNGVVVGAEGTAASAPVLEFAYQQASLMELPLTVVHTGAAVGLKASDDDRLLLAEAVAGMGEKYPDVSVRTEVVRGLPDSTLVGLSDRMDLVVVGRDQSRGADLLHVSIATSVVEQASSPVAVVPIAAG